MFTEKFLEEPLSRVKNESFWSFRKFVVVEWANLYLLLGRGVNFVTMGRLGISELYECELEERFPFISS